VNDTPSRHAHAAGKALTAAAVVGTEGRPAGDERGETAPRW